MGKIGYHRLINTTVLYLLTTMLYFLYSTLDILWQIKCCFCLWSSHTKYNKNLYPLFVLHKYVTIGTYIVIQISIYVTRHEKTMLTCTKYTSLHYFNYLTFCVSYTSSVNCIGFTIVSCTISQKFHWCVMLGQKVIKIQCLKSHARKHCFSSQVTYTSICVRWQFCNTILVYIPSCVAYIRSFTNVNKSVKIFSLHTVSYIVANQYSLCNTIISYSAKYESFNGSSHTLYTLTRHCN